MHHPAPLPHPSIEAELISEVSRLEPDFTDENLKATKLVANVVQETLRLHTAVGQCLPRVVPAGGRELGGFYIPQDTTVGIQAYTMHRDPNVWKEPESFDPTRWENVTPEMKKHFLAFGGGSRSKFSPSFLSPLACHRSSRLIFALRPSFLGNLIVHSSFVSFGIND